MPLRRLTLLATAAGIVLAASGLARPPAAHAEVAPPAPLVAVDAGHGGRDVGAVGEANGRQLVEKELTLAVARRMGDLLRAAGYRVLLTRAADAPVGAGRDVDGDGSVGPADDLQARIDAANAAGASVLVSVHFNGSTSRALRGPE